jgi:hypothetical protein
MSVSLMTEVAPFRHALRAIGNPISVRRRLLQSFLHLRAEALR